MPKGIPGSGPRVKQKRLEAKAQHGNPNIRNEGADGPEKPKPSEGAAPATMPLPAGVKSAKAETAAAVERSQDARQAERAQRDRMARVKSFKVEGEQVSGMGAYVGTAGAPQIRSGLADMAGIVHVEGGHFYITQHDRGGRGSDCQLPTVWFECEVQETVTLTEFKKKLLAADSAAVVLTPEAVVEIDETCVNDDDEEFVF